VREYCSAGVLLGLTDNNPAVIAVIGCGGKTTFIENLANEYRHRKVLITPTTKIWHMPDENIVVRTTSQESITHKPIKGIQYLGILNKLSNKLEALEPELPEEVRLQYDLVLLEADGSQGLPCKGWLPGEPVIPDYCTHTVGITTISALGKRADSDTVLRLPEFQKLTGLQKGDPITRQALKQMVCAGNGMFRNAVGSQSIFVNHAEDNAGISDAMELLSEIRQEYPERFALLAYGSAQENSWKEVWP